MDIKLLGQAALALGSMGAISGIALSFAAKQFHVEVDPRVEAVFEALPGSNCGACGNPSCFAVAEAMVAGSLEPTACTAGGQSAVDDISGILGLEACAVAEAVAARHCGAGERASRRYEYRGVASCASAVKMAGSPILCPAGCLGFGDCVAACVFDAIHLDERGLPVVNLTKCTGCQKCVTECPRHQSGLMAMVPADAPVVVRCASHDKAKAKREYCPVSCIACKKCEKECAYDAITVVDFLAVVDYEKCTGCGVCVSVCPQDCIDLYGKSSFRDVGSADGMAAGVAGFAPERELNEADAL